MRIALVVTGGVDASGRDKVIPALLSLIERLSPQVDLHVFALRYLPESTTYTLLGATVHDLGRPEGIRRQYFALMAAMQRIGAFDLIQAYWALPAGLVSVLAAKRLGVPSMVVFDSGEFIGLPDIGYGAQQTWRQRLGVRLSIQLATRALVCTEYQAGLARALGYTADVVPIGAESRRFVRPADRAEGPPWRLLHVGSINPVKDHDTLLRAFRHLLNRGVDARLDLAGEDTRDGAARALATSLGIADRVVFHGNVPHDELPQFYQQAHLLVHSSRHEAAALVVLEAALSGLPVVGSAVGYIADWNPDRAVGVAPGHPERLADAIQSLLENRRSRTVIANAAHAWAREHDADWTVGAWMRIYRELVGPGAR